MDHVTPLYPASKFASAYCDMQDGKRNLLYLFGLAGLLAPVERENAAVPGRHALDVHAVARVVRAWADCESDIWAGGFVLELNDGSRVYLEGFESDGWGPHSAASVMPMPAGNDLPDLSSNHCANLFGWREAPELAEYLRRGDLMPDEPHGSVRTRPGQLRNGPLVGKRRLCVGHKVRRLQRRRLS
jgi:hypothetical protein